MENEWGVGYTARIMRDSIQPNGYRLITWVLRYPRMVHSELLTHRIFSKCSSSSRAIPVQKMIDNVLKNPVLPVYWGKSQSGMQARQELSPTDKGIAIVRWLAARDSAVVHAKKLLEIGVHKQIANRLLEPWMWIEVVMSSTHHENFFTLRDHPDAQPEIAHLAKMMRSEYDASKPHALNFGEWHIPFVTDAERDCYSMDQLRELAIARCARASYAQHTGEHSCPKDFQLFEKLVSSNPIHASPFEHVACAVDGDMFIGNFIGWKQFRKFIPNESVNEYAKTKA